MKICFDIMDPEERECVQRLLRSDETYFALDHIGSAIRRFRKHCMYEHENAADAYKAIEQLLDDIMEEVNDDF